MTVTASVVVSLSQSLSRWEIAEYICAGLVTIACAGEYVAEFKDWFTDGIKERKDRLAKLSTLLLISALALELICLVRTNTISGMLIGSLSDKAEAADTKSQSAIDKSSTALFQATDAVTKSKDAATKAGAAEASLGKAETEAKNAQAASSSALTIARDARKEADSFEKDIVSAKDAAAQASEKVADRVLTPTQQAGIASRLSTFGSRKIEVIIVGSTGEISRIAAAILAAIRQAGWTIGNSGSAMGGNASGVFVGTHIGSDRDTNAAAVALLSVLDDDGIAVGRMPQYDDQLPVAMIGDWDTKATAPIRIIIGSKP